MQMMSVIEERVMQLTAEVLNLATSPNMKAHLVRDLGADSLDIVNLMMAFEREFLISISDDEVERIGTVGDAIALIESNQSTLIAARNR